MHYLEPLFWQFTCHSVKECRWCLKVGKGHIEVKINFYSGKVHFLLEVLNNYIFATKKIGDSRLIMGACTLNSTHRLSFSRASFKFHWIFNWMRCNLQVIFAKQMSLVKFICIQWASYWTSTKRLQTSVNNLRFLFIEYVHSECINSRLDSSV